MIKNLLEIVNLKNDREVVETLLKIEKINNFRIEKIVSTGQTSEWYDQKEDEIVLLLDGIGNLEFEDGKEINLKKGDFYYIKAHEKHRVSFTSKEPACIWFCIFFESLSN